MSQVNNEQTESHEILIIDYLKLLLKNWYWIGLSMLICCIVVGVYIMVTPKQYQRSLHIMVKEDTKRDIREPDEKTVLRDLNFIFFKTNINNEMELLQSGKIIKDIVEILHLERRYKIRSWLRYIELYNESPIEATFLDAEKERETLSCSVVFLSKKKIKLTNFKKGSTHIFNVTITSAIFDTISTPLGRIIITPTSYFNEEYIDEPIYASKMNKANVIEDLRKNIKVTQHSDNTIIKLLYQDNSIQRADDILNTMITIYNQDNIDYRNHVLANATSFINERLHVIEESLGMVDSDISKYKSHNMINNTKEASYLF
ncbi:MAG: hypothetical protein LBI60_00175, partial [Bacteroidales bacterium]|nr:hypothetical protein [Bacteroidales bacterium]